jgi:hypothetical protein
MFQLPVLMDAQPCVWEIMSEARDLRRSRAASSSWLKVLRSIMALGFTGNDFRQDPCWRPKQKWPGVLPGHS